MKEFSDSDEFLLTLNEFVKSNEKSLKNGNTYLTLNPICVELLNLYLTNKRKSFTVSKSELLDLQFIISLTKYLRIDPNQPELLEKNRIIDLKIFESIKFLELSYVKPGLITNLFSMSQNIEQLIVSGSLNSLDELLVVEDENKLPHYQSISTMIFENDDGEPLSHDELSIKRFQYLYKKNNIWSKLKELDLSFNNIPEIDQSAYSLSSIEKLCFEGNLISKVNNLQECLFLRVLNLSFNRIKDMENINQDLGMITHLSLRGNLIERIESLNKLYALECLDISKNHIKDIQEIFKLNSLPHLQYLFIDENPFCELKDYRNIIISNFLNSDNMIYLLNSFYLDGKKVTESEFEFIKKHTVDNGSFKSYKSPIAKGIKPSSLTTTTATPSSSSSSTPATPSKDVVPVVLPYAPKVDSVESNNINNNNQIKSNNNNSKKNQHKHHHPNFNHSKPIEPVIDSLPEDYIDEETREKQIQDDKFEEEKNLKKKIDELRLEGGNSWLLVLNEMSTFKENNQPPANENNINNHHHHHLTPLTSPMKTKSPIKNAKKQINHNNNKLINNNNNNKITSEKQIENNTSDNNTTTTTTTTTINEIPIITSPTNINSPSTSSTTSSLSTSPINKQNIISPNELICEPFSVSKNNKNLLLQIKIDTILETNLYGHTINSYLLKNIVFVFSVPEAVEPNTAEIVYADKFKDGIPISFVKEYYQMEDQQSLHQLITVLVPPLFKEYTMSCMDCSERYICKSEQHFTHCIKCNSKYLFYVPTTTDSSIMEVESPSAPLPTNHSFLGNSLSFKKGDNLSKLMEYNDDEFNERIFQDQNIQLYFKLKFFKGGSKEVYQYIMRSNFVRYVTGNQTVDEKQINILLSSTTVYLLKDKKSSEINTRSIGIGGSMSLGGNNGSSNASVGSSGISGNQFSVAASLPLNEIRRVSVGLSSQLFRIEMDDQCYVFIKRSQESTEKFIKLLFNQTKALSLPLEPYSRAIETRQAINALLLDPNEEFIKYIMLHHKVSGRNIVPRSLILTNENLYLVIENYHQFPLLNKNIKTYSNQFTIFKNFKITDIIHLKYSKFKPNYFTVAFESENSKSINEWNLITGNSIECDTMISTISNLWKEKFGLDLKIIEYHF